jgi:phiKZ-like phage internal head proteins
MLSFEDMDEAPVLDVQAISLEQECLQACIEPENLLLEESARLDAVSQDLHRDLMQKTDAVVNLNAVASYISQNADKGLLTKQTMVLANVAVEGLFDKAGIRSDKLVFSMESHEGSGRQALNAALEDIKEKISKVFSFLKEKILQVAHHIAKVAGQFNRNILALKYKINRIEEKLHEVTLVKPKLYMVKAESWCEYLCYHSGFIKNHSDISKAVSDFVTEHTVMSSNVIEKYTQWLRDNLSASSTDDVFRNLKFDGQDFLLKDMSTFHRSVGWSAAKGENIYMRTKELPGSRAYYVQLVNGNVSGLVGLRALEDVDFKMSHYDPVSYKTMKSKIIAIAALPMTVWLGAVNPLLGLAAAGLTAGYISQQKVANTGSQQVRIDKNLTFDTMSLENIKKTLVEVRQNMLSLEHWNLEVLHKPWKTRDIDNAVDEIMKEGTASSNIKAYCNALLNLMSNLGTGVHTYAFKVLNAQLNFAEKSLLQFL